MEEVENRLSRSSLNHKGNRMNTSVRNLCTLLLAPLVCLVLVSGCGGLGPHPGTLRVSLADIRVQEMRTLETVFLVDIRILNPNESPLTVRGIECSLIIDGRHFAAGLTGGQFDIPPYDTAVIPVPVYASTLDMVTSVIQYANRSGLQEEQFTPLRYELLGHARLQTGGGETSTSVPFEATGELSFDRPQNQLPNQ